VRVFAGRRPARGALHGGLDVFARQRARGTLVERHDDVGAELLLDAGGQLGREHVPGAVIHGGELDAVVIDAARALQAEHLEAPGIGEDRPVPAHEAVQSAVRRHELGSGPEVQVVGVGEHDTRAQLGEVARLHALHRGLGADGHEAGRLDVAVRRLEARDPGTPVARLDREREALRGHRRRRA